MSEPTFDPLLAELADVIEHADPVPASVLVAAKAAFTWRTIDADLAELVADSLAEAAGVRGREAARLLTFRASAIDGEVDAVAVEVEV